jgi:hypothetical protein
MAKGNPTIQLARAQKSRSSIQLLPNQANRIESSSGGANYIFASPYGIFVGII